MTSPNPSKGGEPETHCTSRHPSLGGDGGGLSFETTSNQMKKLLLSIFGTFALFFGTQALSQKKLPASSY
ncbi:MAG: hypothetical protein QM786_07325 [Breznakibacter sp.]